MKNVSQKVWIGDELVDNPYSLSGEDLSELQRWKRIEVDCPYCLLRTSLNRFAKYTQGTKKYPEKLSRSMMRCPECGEGVQLKTLMKVTNMSVEEFAYWFWDNVFCYRMMERVKGNSFFPRIKLWAYEDRNVFWAIYKEYKSSRNRGHVREDKEKEDADYAEYERAYKAGELDIKEEEDV